MTQEISPTAQRAYEDVAAHGSTDEVLKYARLSTYFREHYPQAVKWAEKQKSQTPIKPALTK